MLRAIYRDLFTTTITSQKHPALNDSIRRRVVTNGNIKSLSVSNFVLHYDMAHGSKRRR
jgi:hypothetical protein